MSAHSASVDTLFRLLDGYKMNPVYIICLVLEIILSIFMVGLILLHSPKGEGMGGIGGSATLFGSVKRGAEAGLDKLTWAFAITFMAISLLLGFGIVRP
jgi:preprotein translocase subunit SecG